MAKAPQAKNKLKLTIFCEIFNEISIILINFIDFLLIFHRWENFLAVPTWTLPFTWATLLEHKKIFAKKINKYFGNRGASHLKISFWGGWTVKNLIASTAKKLLYIVKLIYIFTRICRIKSIMLMSPNPWVHFEKFLPKSLHQNNKFTMLKMPCKRAKYSSP